MLKDHPSHQFEALVLNHVIREGKPLVIEGWGESLPPWIFSKQWLEDNLGTKHEKVRDIPNGVDIPMTLGHYLRSMDQLTKMFSSSKGSYKDERRQRLYMKDIDCPDAWADHLKQVMPESVYYLNDCIESRTGGDGAIREANEYGQMRYGKGVAPAGDLMSSLPPEMRALNMMCYIGHEGTYTPAHREMCASLGQNIMVEASEGGRGEKAGSSIWFMTETSERELVSEYFLSMLGHDIEVEKHFAQVNAWKKAPFNVWVVEQKVGDLILIPPLAPHQVWNRGTRTIKAAWNRTTVDTLELAIHEALPRARMVCRDEQYKCKTIIYYTLANYYELLQRDTIEPKMWKYGRIKQLLDDFKRLFDLYQEIIVSEMFSPKLPEETNVEMLPYDSNVTCSYCRCNIFNRFLTCKSCILYGEDGAEDTYDICMDCYAMGRSCACISNLSWVEQWEWSTLIGNYERWRNIVVQSDGFFDAKRSPQTIDIARKRYGKKPIAEVCQEQLRARPWTDITKPRELTPDMSDDEPEVDDEGRIKVRKGARKGKIPPGRRGRVEPKNGKTHACHICCHHDWNWKLAFCTTCSLAYCYGTLFRAFDLMPQTVMEDKEWQCPRCLKICSCGKCRKSPAQTPYQPKGTLLGHDTRKVADYRSVESLVDFSKTNLTWLRDEDAENPHESGRMKRLKERAQAEKARVDLVDESYLNEEGGRQDNPLASADANGHDHEMADIDPALRSPATSSLPRNGAAQYRSPFGAHPGVNGHEPLAVHADGDGAAPGWIGGHFDFEDHDSYNNSNSANYPPQLLAPVAPMMAPEGMYPDPTHAVPNRMMGVGYYQQDDGIDKIIYDPPNSDGSPDRSPRQFAYSQNPNLAFSDLLDPALRAEQTKKRRRNGNDSDDDVEFFASKRQKALSKRPQSDSQHHRLGKVPPRRSIGKKSYVDLGEDAVPIEDDEGPSMLSHASNKSRAKTTEKATANNNFDMELAALAMSRLSKPKAVEKPVVKRRSFRSRQEAEAEPPILARNTIKTPRKSAWLARKEAQDSAEKFPAELPSKRTNTRRNQGLNDNSKSASPAMQISSASENNGDSGTGIDLNCDVDSLFGEPIEKSTGDQESVTWDHSGKDSSIQMANVNGRFSREATPEVTLPERSIANPMPEAQKKPEKPPPKRRGRPPKKVVAPPPERSKSISPIPATAAPMKKLLSLKEKLALKGKAFKIVAAKESQPSPAGSSSAKSMPRSILRKPSIASPSGWNTANKTHLAPESEPTRTSTPAGPSTSRSTPVSNPAKPPQKNGPTVVRLLSPDSDSEESFRHQSEQSDAEESSFSDENAGIPAVRVTAHKAIRGGRVSLNGRGNRRGRPPKVRA